MSISTGRTAAAYAKRQTTLLTAETLVAANYVETVDCVIEGDAFALEASPEKTPGQDLWESFSRRPSASVRMTSLIRGATGGTGVPQLDPVLAEAMGRAPLVVSAAGGLTSADEAGSVVCIAGAGDGMMRPVRIPDSGAGTPLIPVDGDPIYKSVNYNLGDEILGVTLRYQPRDNLASPDAGTGPGTRGAPPQLSTGWVIDSTVFTLDGTAEARAEFTGPAVRTVEGVDAGDDVEGFPEGRGTINPPNGLVCKMWYAPWMADGSGTWVPVTHPFRTLTIRQNTPRRLRNDEAGARFALGAYIAGQRNTTLEWSTYAEEGHPIWEAVRAGKAAGSVIPYFSIFVALGNVEGSRAGFFMPRVAFNLPQGDDGAEAIAWTFQGRAHSNLYDETNSSLAIGLG